MTRTFTLIAVASAALAACGQENHNLVAGDVYDPQANAVQNLDQVELPPSIIATHSYRCSDNSVVYIDWRSNDTARIKQSADGAGVTVTKGEDGAYTADGQTLSGAPSDQTVTVNGQACKR